jgi:hypothetical protein
MAFALVFGNMGATTRDNCQDSRDEGAGLDFYTDGSFTGRRCDIAFYSHQWLNERAVKFDYRQSIAGLATGGWG